MHIPLQNDWYVGHWHMPPTQSWPPGHVVVQGPPPLLDPVDPLDPVLPPDPVLPLDPLLLPDPLLPLPPDPLVLPASPFPLFPLDEVLPHAAATAVAAASARQNPSELRIFASQ
jgi:hypothetical protein